MKFKCLKFKTFILIVLTSTFYFLTSNSLAQENNSPDTKYRGSSILLSTQNVEQNRDDKILDLRQQIQELERQSAEYKEQIKTKQNEGETLKKELGILESRIANLKVSILATGRRIELAGLEIKDLNGEILKTEKEIKKNKESISGLLREIQTIESHDLASIILANPHISVFFNHVQQINNLRDRLIADFNAFLDLKKIFKERKETAENKKEEMETLNKKQENQKAAHEGTQTAKNDLLAKTKGDEKKFQELLSETEKKKAEFYKELQSLEAEAQRQGIYIVHVKAEIIPLKGTKLFKMPMDDYIITQRYGMTAFAKRGAYGGAPHNGIDIKAGLGSEIKSIGPGTVLAKGFNNAGGNWIAIRHDNDLVSIYGHMKEPALVLVGEKVSENTIIGFEGATGFVTGSHLHLSLYYEFFTFIGPKTGQVYFNYFQGSLNPLDYL